MGLIETAGSISAAEKIGWLGLIGTFFVACAKLVKFLANFSEEHRLLMENMKAAPDQRREMVEEIRGLRGDLNELYNILIQRR